MVWYSWNLERARAFWLHLISLILFLCTPAACPICSLFNQTLPWNGSGILCTHNLECGALKKDTSIYLDAEHIVQWFSTCGSWPLWGSTTLSWETDIRYPAYLILILWFITSAKIQLWSSHELIFWLGVTTTWGMVLKSHSIRKVDKPLL